MFAGGPSPGSDEPVHRDTPNYEEIQWEVTRKVVRRAEDLGFDAFWAPDHLLLGCDHAEYEVWTLHSALAEATDDMRFGPLVLANDYRNPALVWKMAAPLDYISGGRLEPDSVQDPYPPILVGGTGEQITLKLVAKHADIWNTDVFRAPETLTHNIPVIVDYCDIVGRDSSEIEYAWDGHVIYTHDEGTIEAMLDTILPIQFEEEFIDKPDIETRGDAEQHFIMGDPEECVEAFERRTDVEITKFMFWLLDYPT